MLFGTPIGPAASFVANLILIAHFTWAVWMIAGVVLAVAGFRWRRLWQWRVFRFAHLTGLVGTATVPFWAEGICPLTTWEWTLRPPTGRLGGDDSFIIHWVRETLFLDVDPLILSLVTGAAALATLVIFIFRPPWRQYT